MIIDHNQIDWASLPIQKMTLIDLLDNADLSGDEFDAVSGTVELIHYLLDSYFEQVIRPEDAALLTEDAEV